MTPKEPLASDEWKHNGARKRKDTKRWCKGKVGREHTPEKLINTRFTDLLTKRKVETGEYCRPPGSHPSGRPKLFDCLHHTVCSTCGKELEWVSKVCPTYGEPR